MKRYGQKCGKGELIFNAIICSCAMLYAVITEVLKTEYAFFFPKELWGYGLISGAFYATGFYTAYVALKIGSFGMTKLLSAFGTIIPIVYGIAFLKEPATVFTLISVILILLSVFLMNYQRVPESKERKVPTKWWICVLLTVLANAGIAIITKMQQVKFETRCSNEFLMISYAVAASSLVVLGVVYERSHIKTVIKTGLLYGGLAGILNGVNNLMIILTYLYVPISVVSPVKTALSLVLSFLISAFIYKEKFTRQQLLSVLIGIVAVILVNIKG